MKFYPTQKIKVVEPNYDDIPEENCVNFYEVIKVMSISVLVKDLDTKEIVEFKKSMLNDFYEVTLLKY